MRSTTLLRTLNALYAGRIYVAIVAILRTAVSSCQSLVNVRWISCQFLSPNAVVRLTTKDSPGDEITTELAPHLPLRWHCQLTRLGFRTLTVI